MYKKMIIYITGFLLSLTVTVAANAQSSKTLAVKQVLQERNNWCWNASIQMVSRYHGKCYAEQSETAELGRKIWPQLFGDTNCSLSPDHGCNFQVGVDVIRDFLKIFGMDSTFQDRALTFDECRTEIDNNRPFIMQWFWRSSTTNKVTAGHTIAVSGYSEQDPANPQLIINNPTSSETSIMMSYNEVVNYHGGKWEKSITVNPPQNNSVIVYENENYDPIGGSATILEDTGKLGVDINNKISSAKVFGVPFLFYDDYYFGLGHGSAWGVSPGTYGSYTDWTYNDVDQDNLISSIRPVPGAASGSAVILFDQVDYKGNFKIAYVDEDSVHIPEYTEAGLVETMKVRSAIVLSDIWLLFPDGSGNTQPGTGPAHKGFHFTLTNFGGPNRDGFYPNSQSWGGDVLEIISCEKVTPDEQPIILYEHANLTGSAVTFTKDSLHEKDNLSFYEFNEYDNFQTKVSSIKTFSGRWTIYEKNNHDVNEDKLELYSHMWYVNAAGWGSFDVSSLEHTEDHIYRLGFND
ncbi:MAG: hypothetical protein GY754_08825 [bacterium]|nr:hypothetical protein [bacterium]